MALLHPYFHGIYEDCSKASFTLKVLDPPSDTEASENTREKKRKKRFFFF
jgi:hypothetical protein